MTNTHNVVQNNSITINLLPNVKSRGYTLSGSSVTHVNGYDGDAPLVVKAFPIIAEATYEISFTVSGSDSSTNLTYTLGGATSTPITSNTFVQSSITAEEDGFLTFNGNGNFTITDLTLMRVNMDVTSTSEDTITFSEERNKWVTYKSLVPDCGFSMYTNLFTYKDGNLYKHSDQAIPNNFYGEQFHSLIKFPISSLGVKTYLSLGLHANKDLETTVDGVTTQLGQVSDLVAEDFQLREGVRSAVFLRDKATGLLDGDYLKGRYIEIELTDELTATENLKLFKVIVKSNISSPNE